MIEKTILGHLVLFRVNGNRFQNALVYTLYSIEYTIWPCSIYAFNQNRIYYVYICIYFMISYDFKYI